ncbi:MAG: AmmeMemoRadiSam system protein B [candidate division NC10 bacterium]|nr:AmmeMemoRadiSam system protein B [candidate division NC10 bacterium]MBI4841669.1 AmmeMemoRadiSam system protein B [candidate division NC10 bacterium]
MTTRSDTDTYEYPRLRPVEAFPAVVSGQEVLCLRDPQQYSEVVVYVPAQTASILGLFDGQHSLLDIQEAFTRRFGSLLFREQLLQVIQSLDERLLLESPRFATHRAKVEDGFRRSRSRKAMLAGKSYPPEATGLRQQLESYFTAAEGPGDTPPSPAAAGLSGLVVPHIDFARGGPCYAWGYRELEGAASPVDRWVILGTVHAPIARAFALTRKDFETPLGTVETDQEFVDRLLASVGDQYLEDELAHRGEHSIEFQAVFLRHVTPSASPVRIVPILCGSLHRFIEDRRSPSEERDIEAFLAAVRDTMAGLGGRSLVLASADLAHVGPRFGDPRQITPGQLREVADADREMLETIEAGDAEAFFRAVARDGDRRRICGLPPIYAALRVLPGAQGRVLRYRQWPDPQGTVTFSAVALYR